MFMLNRPSPPTKQAPAPERWQVQAYRYEGVSPEGNWVPAGDSPDAKHWALVQASPAHAAVGGQVEVQVLIDLGRGKKMRLQSHDELGLQYAPLQPDFASMWTMDGEAVGLHFSSATQQEAFKLALDSAVREPASSGVLWCLSHVNSRRDETVRRGAQVKALAVCSRFQFISAWKPLLLLAIDRLYSTSTGCVLPRGGCSVWKER